MMNMANVERLLSFLNHGFVEESTGKYTMEYKNSTFTYDLYEETLTAIDDKEIGNTTITYTNIDTVEKLTLRLNHISLVKYDDYIVDTSSL